MDSLEESLHFSNTIPLPSLRTRILTRISHTIMAGCVTGLLYFGLQEPPEDFKYHPALISPDAQYYVSPIHPNTLESTNLQHHPSITLHPGETKRISAQGNYVTQECKNSYGSTMFLLYSRNGAEIPLPPNIQDIAVLPNEQGAAILSNRELSLLLFHPRTIKHGGPLPPISLTEEQSCHLMTPSFPRDHKAFQTSPDSSTILAIICYHPPTFTFWKPSSGSPPRTYSFPNLYLLSGDWIEGNTFLAHLTNKNKTEIHLFSPITQSTIPHPNHYETIFATTPFGNTYFTKHQPSSLSEGFSSIITTRSTTATTSSNILLLSGMIEEAATSKDGTLAISQLHVTKKSLDYSLTILSPPTYSIRQHIQDARHPFFTTDNALGYCSTNKSLSPFHHIVRRRDLLTNIDTQLFNPPDPTETHLTHTSLATLLLGLPLLGMGIYYLRQEHQHLKTLLHHTFGNPTTAYYPLLASTLVIACASLYPLPLLLTPYQTPLKKLAWWAGPQTMTLLFGAATYPLFHFAARLKKPRVKSLWSFLFSPTHNQSDKDLKPPSPHFIPTPLHLLSPLLIPPHQEYLQRGRKELRDQQYSHARLSYYQAMEAREHTPFPSPYSFIHFIVSHASRFAEIAQYHHEKRRHSPIDDHASYLEYHQATLACLGFSHPALALTNQILSHNCSDPIGARLHQARIHSLFGSNTAFELWERSISDILNQIPPESFIQVSGGTSEVLTVPESINPYAGKSLILKRNTNKTELREEFTITSLISNATGGVNGMSSTPLAFVKTINQKTESQNSHSYSYIPLIQHQGKTLESFLRGTTPIYREAFLRETLLPALLNYHTKLKQEEHQLTHVLPTLHYSQLYREKFVERITESFDQRSALLKSGAAVIQFLESTPRQPAHNDLHARNIIVSESPNTLSVKFIDPREAAFGHAYLDIAHLLFDPALNLNLMTIQSLMEYYRLLARNQPQDYRAQDCAITWLRLCHLVGRDKAYQRPEEFAPHARSLTSITYTLSSFSIPGVTISTLSPVLEAVSQTGILTTFDSPERIRR